MQLERLKRSFSASEMNAKKNIEKTTRDKNIYEFVSLSIDIILLGKKELIYQKKKKHLHLQYN